MLGEAQQQFMQRIRAALAAGRDVDPPFARTPAHIDPQVRRLVGEDEDLTARFTAAATEAGARVHAVANLTQAVTTVLDLLGEAGAKDVLVGEGGLVSECGMVDAIKAAGLRAVRWREITEPNQESVHLQVEAVTPVNAPAAAFRPEWLLSLPSDPPSGLAAPQP